MSGISSKRKSYVLTVKPVNYSLTDGTNIPPPPESPPLPPADIKKAGPVSHPGIESMPGAFPTDPLSSNGRKNSISTIGTLEPSRGRADSFRTPMSPASAKQPQTHPNTDKPHVRRMFSLNSLRQSFSSSRTSLALPRGSSHDVDHDGDHPPRPESRASTAMASISGDSTRPRTRSRRSSTWLRRRSFFLGGNSDAMLDVVNEDPRESKRFKESKPAPLLPEVGTLRGGRLNNGNLGWDEGIFQKK